MANVEHSALTGANIHEPKGIGLAGIGDTYVADGGGSGNWQLPAFSGLVAVAEKNDFPTPIAGIITLAASTTYIITTDIDLGSDTILYSTGSNLLGFNREVNILRTNSAVALVTSTGQHFQIQGLHLTNPSGPLFDIEGDNLFAAVFDTMLIDNCVTVGTITDCISVVMDRVASLGTIASTNGFRFSGTFDELFVRHCYFKQWTGNLFDLATDSPVFDIISFLGTRFFGDTLLVAINGLAASANVNDFGVVLGSAFDNMTNPITGILKSDAKWGFQANAGLANSAIIGFVSMTANATETVITTSSGGVGPSDYVKMLGTTTASPSNERFTTPSSNRLDFTGIRDAQIRLTANVASVRVGGGPINIHTVTFFKNGSQLNATVESAGGSAGDPQNATLTAIDTATDGDFYEIFIANDTDTTNIVVTDLQFSIGI